MSGTHTNERIFPRQIATVGLVGCRTTGVSEPTEVMYMTETTVIFSACTGDACAHISMHSAINIFILPPRSASRFVVESGKSRGIVYGSTLAHSGDALGYFRLPGGKFSNSFAKFLPQKTQSCLPQHRRDHCQDYSHKRVIEYAPA